MGIVSSLRYCPVCNTLGSHTACLLFLLRLSVYYDSIYDTFANISGSVDFEYKIRTRTVFSSWKYPCNEYVSCFSWMLTKKEERRRLF